MTQEETKELQKEIKVLIKKLHIEVADLEESAKPVAPENSIGRVSRMDAINNKSVVEVSLRNRKNKLSKLQLALTKIKKPGFGLCSNCRSPINPKRLMLLPESDKCMKCA